MRGIRVESFEHLTVVSSAQMSLIIKNAILRPANMGGIDVKTIAMLGCLMLCAGLVGCDRKTEREKTQEQTVQSIIDEQTAWDAAQDASYAIVDSVTEEMSYDQVVEMLGSTGEQKMNAEANGIRRTIYEWTLDGDVFVKGTFSDGILKKWETN